MAWYPDPRSLRLDTLYAIEADIRGRVGEVLRENVSTPYDRITTGNIFHFNLDLTEHA
jgi:hypothetical protein